MIKTLKRADNCPCGRPKIGRGIAGEDGGAGGGGGFNK